jgi:hypothetical protein
MFALLGNRESFDGIFYWNLTTKFSRIKGEGLVFYTQLGFYGARPAYRYTFLGGGGHLYKRLGPTGRPTG